MTTTTFDAPTDTDTTGEKSRTDTDTTGQSDVQNVSSLNKWLLISSGILAFGYAPLLIEHLCNLWLRPHYQFIAFLPVAVGLLWWRGYHELREEYALRGISIMRSESPLLWGPCFFIALLTLGLATYMRSPWLAVISLPIMVLGILLLLFGRQGLPAMLPGWLMLFVAVPLPGNLDVRLIGGLRNLTTQWSSAVLDAFGVLHRVRGNMIELPEISLFVADACTGIHSLFVLIAAAVFVGLLNRRTLVHIVLLVSSTVGLVLMENISRVSLVTMLCQHNALFSEGWRHSLLGFVLFAVSLLLIFSLDALIFVLVPVRDWRLVWRWLWDSWTHLEAVPEAAEDTTRVWPLQKYLSRGMIPVYTSMVILGTAQLAWVPSRAGQITQMMKRSPIELGELGANALPAQYKGWKRVDYQIINRVLEDPLGENSQRWTYERDGQEVMISLDYPYLRVHDLTLCYQGIGWQLGSKVVTQADNQLPYVHALLSMSLRGHALLDYSLHSQDGRCEVILDETTSFSELYQKRFEYDRPWFQIQLMTTSVQPMPAEVLDEFNLMFVTLRRSLLERCQTTAKQ